MRKIAVLFLIVGFFTNCKKEVQNNSNGKLKVLSSFSIISDMVREIGKDSVVVHNLVPIGTDPHEYEPKTNDIKFASNADLFLYNGLNLEGGEQGWFFKLLHALEIKESQVFQVSKQITPLFLSDSKLNDDLNPHAFVNPGSGILMAKEIEKSLIEVDPKNKEFYIQNSEKYISKLQAIEEKYHKKLNEIPVDNRILVTGERAFQYLAKEYNLKEGYIWAIDTEENGSPNQIKKTIEFIKKYKPTVLFVESNIDRRPMDIISKETGIPVYKLPLYSDELGKSEGKINSYIEYLEYNLDVIYDGLTID